MTKKIYFASDFHLGSPNHQQSRLREDRIVRWLNFIEPTCSELFLMGDVFDFWFEYKMVIPKGYARLQGKLANMSDAGIKIYFFKGNHDMWVRDYFTTELGMEIISDELEIERNGKRFYLHHGDGLGPGDHKYKFLRKVFRNPLCQWLFALVPARIGIGVANAWSHSSKTKKAHAFTVPEDEWLFTHAIEQLGKKHYDYFIFGHRHLPLDLKVGANSRYVNTGEWMNYSSYAEFDGDTLMLKYFEKEY